jgi:hypothetical protein
MNAEELTKLADRYEGEARQYEREDAQHDPSRREIVEWRATAAALRLAATLEEFFALPFCPEVVFLGNQFRADCRNATAYGSTPIEAMRAAIDAAKPKPHEHEFGPWFYKEAIGQYVRACGNLCVAEFADRLVPAHD